MAAPQLRKTAKAAPPKGAFAKKMESDSDEEDEYNYA
jgi:hypothetical protein